MNKLLKLDAHKDYRNLCNAYAQLGARGTSILFSSGDGGVSGSQASDACDGSEFIPTFPSGCPLYVISAIVTVNR